MGKWGKLPKNQIQSEAALHQLENSPVGDDCEEDVWMSEHKSWSRKEPGKE